jgi:hypothetical protein
MASGSRACNAKQGGCAQGPSGSRLAAAISIIGHRERLLATTSEKLTSLRFIVLKPKVSSHSD